MFSLSYRTKGLLPKAAALCCAGRLIFSLQAALVSSLGTLATYEKVETIPLIVIKKDKNRETYDRSKIESGVVRSCHKRPVSVDQIEACVDEIENKIFNLGVREIESEKIGEIVMDQIRDLDQVAYVRFASVYRQFKDADTFMSELKKLLDTK